VAEHAHLNDQYERKQCFENLSGRRENQLYRNRVTAKRTKAKIAVGAFARKHLPAARGVASFL